MVHGGIDGEWWREAGVGRDQEEEDEEAPGSQDLRADEDLLDDFDLVVGEVIVQEEQVDRLDDADLRLDSDREWQGLRALWAALPEPEIDPARIERVFQNVMRTIERRRRWRRLALMGAALMAPVALVGAVRFARAYG